MKEVVLSLVLGTATPGGGFPVYGEAFAEMVNAQEPALRVQARNTKGSGENVPLLEAHKLDLALVAGEVANRRSRSRTRPCALLRRCTRRRACSSCGPTARIAPFQI